MIVSDLTQHPAHITITQLPTKGILLNQTQQIQQGHKQYNTIMNGQRGFYLTYKFTNNQVQYPHQHIVDTDHVMFTVTGIFYFLYCYFLSNILL